MIFHLIIKIILNKSLILIVQMDIYKLDIDSSFLNGKNILITGGTGSFGHKIVETLLTFKPNKIIIFSRDEFKQYHMKKKFPEIDKLGNDTCMRYLIGDIRDLDRLNFAFCNVDIIFHAAALKQVPAMEYNPTEAIKTNIYGAENVIRAAINNNVNKIIAISTDKAVSPVNLYGATKMCFEKLFLAANNLVGNRNISFSVMRYGNVFGSRGSVIPLFLEQTKNNKFTITDKRMTRFTITLQDAINFVLNSASKMIGKEIFIPKLPSYNIVQLAKAINPDAEIDYIGIRPGEKIHECMISTHESQNTLNCKNYYIVLPDKRRIDKYTEAYKDDFISVRTENSEYNSGNNGLIDESKLKDLINKYSTLVK